MNTPFSSHQHLQTLLSQPHQAPNEQLHNALRYLAKWRSSLIQNTLLKDMGAVVSGGPFKGMEFIAQSAEGCHTPKLLGCYEQALWPHMERVLKKGHEHVLNIGCAEGYYAVGLARCLKTARIYAHDTNTSAQDVCLELARRNRVDQRVFVDGLFTPNDFSRHAAYKTLVFCDIEGHEHQLLDPVTAPALAGMDMIIESHECFQPGLTQSLTERFAATHSITVVHDNGERHVPSPPDWFKNLGHLDQLLAVWEWRSGPTPWLILEAKNTWNA